MHLTKTYEPADLTREELQPLLRVVDNWFDSASPPSPHRRWEYALALRAFQCHFPAEEGRDEQVEVVYDIGGAGSPFQKTLQVLLPRRTAAVTLIDQEVNFPLEIYIRQNPNLGDAVFCISVLEHVENPDEFLYHLSCLTAPGGLLFLTVDAWNREGPDTAHFSHMRKQIFSVAEWQRIGMTLQSWGFEFLGPTDWVYHDHQLYGSYTFASIAMTKRL